MFVGDYPRGRRRPFHSACSADGMRTDVSLSRRSSVPPQVATMLQVQGGGRILRPPGGPVDLDRHPAGGGPRFDQFERTVLARVGQQPRTLADDDWEGEEGHLVDKLVVEQPPDQNAAA